MLSSEAVLLLLTLFLFISKENNTSPTKKVITPKRRHSEVGGFDDYSPPFKKKVFTPIAEGIRHIFSLARSGFGSLHSFSLSHLAHAHFAGSRSLPSLLCPSLTPRPSLALAPSPQALAFSSCSCSLLLPPSPPLLLALPPLSPLPLARRSKQGRLLARGPRGGGPASGGGSARGGGAAIVGG